MEGFTYEGTAFEEMMIARVPGCQYDIQMSDITVRYPIIETVFNYTVDDQDGNLNQKIVYGDPYNLFDDLDVVCVNSCIEKDPRHVYVEYRVWYNTMHSIHTWDEDSGCVPHIILNDEIPPTYWILEYILYSNEEDMFYSQRVAVIGGYVKSMKRYLMSPIELRRLAALDEASLVVQAIKVSLPSSSVFDGIDAIDII